MNLLQTYEANGVSRPVYEYGESVLDALRDRFDAIDRMAELNQGKVIRAMQDARVDAACFAATTGYGYDDVGRDRLEEVYASVFGTEAALVRPQITCGTHALTVALSANLLPGDELLSPVGLPYDTLQEVIGIRPSPCSLAEYGVRYRQVDLLPDGGFDYPAIRAAIHEKTKLITIQRSKGYATRPSFSVAQIGELISFCKGVKPDVLVMVDNCYGEFVEELEPSQVGADLCVGSLIKNPGGGLAPIGGYIVGTKACVERCAYRLSAPGLGQEVGANLGILPSFYQGLFLAPTVVAGALKGAIFAACLYERLGFRVVPGGAEERHDIIQAVELGSEAGMRAFCKGIQAAAPVDSYVEPIPWAMPGYDDEVIMAAGAFVQGSSIELSADGPIRPPYAVYFQGGLTWYHAKLGILRSLQSMVDAGLTEVPTVV
ncbi:MAG: methionine gamma-lyase family protein [Oscillospiraceae bacterium]|jgi:cystathionine beta-lyase family protein involved in aluminum resistance|nr:methionine gamma-lyase family protein [Oscillospiraceae bacterium]MBQ9374141.1 methionine gamma-lyase family protein [Oscillospiraceae bacterium]